MAKTDCDRLGELLQEVFSVKDGAKRLLEHLVNQAMAAEIGEHLGAAHHERTESRLGYRNGSKPRTMKTRVGELELSVPQVRGCDPYHPSMFGKWERSERALLVACAEMYFQGVSTRNVRNVLDVMCDGDISSSTVSRVAQELDEKLLTFRHRRLDASDWPYLHIDARYEKVRVHGRVVSQAVLVAVGFTSEGRREVLDWRVGDSESEDTWGALFGSLKDRGLGGLLLVTSDAHGGIVSALARHFQGVAWQRCRVHFKRELFKKVSYKLAKELMADITSVFLPEDLEECLRRGEEMACKWESRYPKVASQLRDGLESCLTVLTFPEHHRQRLRSTNMLENLMRRLKKRSRVVGVFPNRSSCDRLLGAQLLEVHECWSVERSAYFNMKNVDWETVQSDLAETLVTAA
ncbi:IS256 family transposase [Candidatus Bipolaricaulota bacterium]|nr:IS256 family transposase [Candidatus Bipolaricaulota bacterium]